MIVEGKESIRATEEKLADIIEVLSDIYRRAADEMDEKSRKYFERFEAQDKKMREKLDRDEITALEYADWLQNKLMYGRRYEAFRREFTERLANVNEVALAYINGEMPEVYVTNYNNFGTATINAAGTEIAEKLTFELIDEDTVRLLATENPDLLPRKKLDVDRDKQWNRKKMQAEILQGILLGEDIPTIAKRLRKVTDMNEASAIRNARTMVTSAQNRGRMEGMRRTSAMGLVQKKHWMSSDQPGRTRDWHMPGAFVSLTVDVDEPFENELGKIDYPGDPGAAPANVYNCRCTLASEVIGFIDPLTGEYKPVKYGGK